MHRHDWPETAMQLAESIAASRSEHPNIEERVGACCIRHDHSVASLGYNGTPPNVDIDWTGPERKTHVIHAEVNALRYVRPGEVDFMAVTMSPCSPCLTVISSYGIKKVYYRKKYDKGDEAIKTATSLGIELIQI